jgi:hypothetical protein
MGIGRHGGIKKQTSYDYLKQRFTFQGFTSKKDVFLNFSPPLEASHFKSPFCSVNIITPFAYFALAEAPDFAATAYLSEQPDTDHKK